MTITPQRAAQIAVEGIEGVREHEASWGQDTNLALDFNDAVFTATLTWLDGHRPPIARSAKTIHTALLNLANALGSRNTVDFIN